MGKIKNIKIGALEFGTQKEAKNFVKEKVTTLGEDSCIDSKHEDWIFFHDLIKGHHEWKSKYGTGVLKFEIRRNQKFRKNLEIWIVRSDSSEVDISWHKSVEGVKTSPIKNLNSAMRATIDDQIDEFKKSEYYDGITCYICGNEIKSLENLHIDHYEPTFLELFDDFLKNNPVFPKSFADCEVSCRALFKKEDLKYREKWCQFHKDKANLRCTHTSCNLKRKKK